MKKNIIFDFDGVILNSHKVKTNAFYDLFKKYGKKLAEKSKSYHLKNIGKNRYYKFKFIVENYLKIKISKKILNDLDKKFDFYISKKIDHLTVSENLKKFFSLKNKYNFYISTGTPKHKMIKILKKKKILNNFKNVYGSPSNKIQHLKLIKKNKKPCIFIGDSVEDYNAAKKAKINFLLKINSENELFRKKNKDLIKINSFKNLDKVISSILNEKK
jgi:HAD superfamily hydrolase (TIGR01549 family)